MKKLFIILVLCMYADFAFGFSSTDFVACTLNSFGGECDDYAKTYCGGATAGCGSVKLNGTSYTNSTSKKGYCYCIACGGNTVQPSGTNAYCECNINNCTQSVSTNSSSHLQTITYGGGSSSTNCFNPKSGGSTSEAYFCSGQGKGYKCAPGYGSWYSPTSTTKCYSCDAKGYASSYGGTISSNTGCSASNSYAGAVYAIGAKYYYKAWDARYVSSYQPTSAPSSVALSNCGACASDCFYVSPISVKYNDTCYGVILRGCEVQYGTKSCSTSVSGCAHAVHDVGKCVCGAGYYGTAADACNECPADPSGLQTSDKGATTATQCYIPAGASFTDNTGTYHFGEACYYLE